MPIVMIDFKRKGNFALLQIRDALDAYGRLDEHRAEAVWLRNIQVREELDSVTNKIISIMIENPRAITASAQLLFISKNFEHIISHVVHISEAVHHMVTGEMFPVEQQNRALAAGD
jgi:phosphate transport system protein